MFKKALSTLNARPLHRTEMHSPSPSSAALRAPPSTLSIYVLYFIALTVDGPFPQFRRRPAAALRPQLIRGASHHHLVCGVPQPQPHCCVPRTMRGE
jgi:hypothetical protein